MIWHNRGFGELFGGDTRQAEAAKVIKCFLYRSTCHFLGGTLVS